MRFSAPAKSLDALDGIYTSLAAISYSARAISQHFRPPWNTLLEAGKMKSFPRLVLLWCRF